MLEEVGIPRPGLPVQMTRCLINKRLSYLIFVLSKFEFLWILYDVIVTTYVEETTVHVWKKSFKEQCVIDAFDYVIS